MLLNRISDQKSFKIQSNKMKCGFIVPMVCLVERNAGFSKRAAKSNLDFEAIHPSDFGPLRLLSHHPESLPSSFFCILWPEQDLRYAIGVPEKIADAGVNLRKN